MLVSSRKLLFLRREIEKQRSHGKKKDRRERAYIAKGTTRTNGGHTGTPVRRRN
jgi:hypothetical protein